MKYFLSGMVNTR